MKRAAFIPVVFGAFLALSIAAGTVNAQSVDNRHPEPSAAVSDRAATPIVISPEYSGSDSSPVTFEYLIPASGYVRVCLYDANGRTVEILVNAYREAGSHRAVWIPAGSPTGVYTCVLSVGSVSVVRTVILQ